MTSGKNQTKLLLRFLPTHSRLIASSWPETIQTPFPRLQVTAIQGLPEESADGVIIDERAAQNDRSSIPALLRLTAPGGIAVFDVPDTWLSKTDWQGLSAGAGFRIIYEKRTSGRLYGVLERPDLPPAKSDMSFSVILPVTADAGPGSYPTTAASVFSWMTFFLRYNLYDRSEFILIDDDVMRGPQGSDLEEAIRQGSVQIVHHFKSFGPEESILTGLRRARGRRVLIDLSGGGVDKESLLAMLEPVLREEKALKSRRPDNDGRSILYGWTPSRRAPKENVIRRARRRIIKAFTGSVNPTSDFRLYPRDAVRQICLRRDIRTLTQGTLPRALKKDGYQIVDMPVGRSDEALDQLPGLLRTFAQWVW